LQYNHFTCGYKFSPNAVKRNINLKTITILTPKPEVATSVAIWVNMLNPAHLNLLNRVAKNCKILLKACKKLQLESDNNSKILLKNGQFLREHQIVKCCQKKI